MDFNKKETIDLQTVYSSLVSGNFSMKKELLNTIKEMIKASETLRDEYSIIRRILQDKKLSWKEIENLQNFLGITISKTWKKEFEPICMVLKNFISNMAGIFEKRQYIRDIHYRAFPEGYDSEKHFFYFLSGSKFFSIIQASIDIIDISTEFKPIKGQFSTLEDLLIKYFQLLGDIGMNITPYMLIIQEEEDIDPKHPLRQYTELNHLEEEIQRNIRQILFDEILELSNNAEIGLNKFLKDKSLDKDEFKIYTIFGSKEGVKEIRKLFIYLEERIKFEERLYFY